LEIFVMRLSIAALAGALLWSLSGAVSVADTAVALDIKKAVPNDAHMALYGKHNPERDYQAQYFAEAWETFQNEKIAERIFKLIASRAPKDKLAEVQNAWSEVKEAVGPINGQALLDSEEFVFANVLQGPVNQTLAVIRLSDEDAADYQEGVGKLFELVQKWSQGKVTAGSSETDDVTVTRLELPPQSPVQPAVAHLGDLFIVSTSAQLLNQAVSQLQNETAVSKFDDPRLKESLEHLPKSEDMLGFFDGRQLFVGLHSIPDFIRANVKGGDDAKEQAERIAGAVNDAINQCEIIDYVVTVESTEDGQNRTSQLGKLSAGYDTKLLGKALAQGEPFEDWQSWIPADATAFALKTGVNWHVLYDGVMKYVREEFPESHSMLDQFDQMQASVNVNLDEDVLQSFSGESVSITLPGGSTTAAKNESVLAWKCSDPDKIRALIDRAVAGLNNIPQVAAQGLELEDSDELDGFQELKAAALQMTGARPVIGFPDGWMVFASSPDAAQKFLDVRAGEADSIADSTKIARFDIKADGKVYAASYSDVGEGVRQVAATLEQMGMMLPVYIGMATADAKPEDKQTINDALSLLPSVAKVVGKFDFFEDKLSITQEGPLPDSFLVESVTNIRQPEEN